MMRSTDECILWPYKRNTAQPGRKGYGQVFIDGVHKSVHVLACELAHGPAPVPGMVASHGPCHNSLCFNPRHLSWQTHVENAADRLRDGTSNRGERNGRVKLSEGDVRAIRAALRSGETHAKVAGRFGIHRNHVGAIARGTKWGWLEQGG